MEDKRRSNSNYLNAIYNQYNVLKDVNLSPSDLNRTKESQMNLSNFQAIEDSDVIISFDSQSKCLPPFNRIKPFFDKHQRDEFASLCSFCSFCSFCSMLQIVFSLSNVQHSNLNETSNSLSLSLWIFQFVYFYISSVHQTPVPNRWITLILANSLSKV